MGRRPKPAAVAKAQGNPGRRPLKKKLAAEKAAVPAAETAIEKPSPSIWLETLRKHKKRDGKAIAEAAEAVWAKLYPELKQIKLLRSTDENAFARYCVYMAEWQHFTNILYADGFTYKTDSDHVTGLRRPHPAFRFRKDTEQMLRDMEDRFGLTPAMRQRIQLQLANALPGDLPGKTSADEGSGEAAKQPDAVPQRGGGELPLGFLGSPPAGSKPH